ncbi:unnamed protein product (macronuclear) [Paramecium tetraurelia]|uniref:CHY-type domain-containing protein n=1 Tax=Paramecium tetraurelia TaxID=5888 RepID=A0DLU8_PARTE|nr:uncharacterized protein GSPATT00039647001 [Paramecium tetraurelia]CAK84015.1 unnamed protein product [Paramecium tetraurelia]|eukprot:XP_001451412.1 hypothetical protein (macronuclear) [Paramecium tetraurelia strain d4-2]
MSDSKTSPRNHGRSKTKTSENLQILFKKSSVANERLVVNKLGMKFDPVCWKKNHEKGRIQFFCIVNLWHLKQESNCKADRRLACAHCIIEEHQEHISNKITVEQYCDSFESNFKSYLFQIAKLEEYYKKCKMLDLINQIDKDINTVLEIVKQQLRVLRDFYVQEIQIHAEQNNSSLISFYNMEKQTLSKIKDYAQKNLFEMTPPEMDHSMLLLGQNHLDNITLKIQQFGDQNSIVYSTLKSQWKLIYEQLEESLIDAIALISQNNLDFNQPTIKETSQEHSKSTNQQQQQDFQKLNLQDFKIQNKQMNQQYTQNYQQLPPQHSQDFQQIKKEVSKHSGNTIQQQQSNPPINQTNNQLQSNSPKASNEVQSYKQNHSISQHQVTSPLKSGVNIATFGNLGNANQKSFKKHMSQPKTNEVYAQSKTDQNNNSNAKSSSLVRQASANGVNYYYQSDGKHLEGRKNGYHIQTLNSSSQQKQQYQFERRLSAPKIQNTHFNCNYNNMKCIHNDIVKTSPVFSCCNWAFPCYECHDMISTHKAHITVPSQRFCLNCQEIFSVNLLSTVDVKCYKCQ